MFCGETCTSNHDSTTVVVNRLHCRCWHCEHCNEIRLRELKDIARSGYPTHMITLTASSAYYDEPADMARALVHGWRMVLQRAKREGRIQHIEYLAVFEEHKSGYPHLHILSRGPNIDQPWLSERMAEYAHGPNVWISRVTNPRNAARYLAKYVSKGPCRYEGCKRYWRSMRYKLEPTGWERDTPVHDRSILFHSRCPESVADTYRRVGWTVNWRSWWVFEAYPYEPGWPGPWFESMIWLKRPLNTTGANRASHD